MPQASEELRKEWDGPDEQTAIKYLKDRGYVLTDKWLWRKPHPDYKPTVKEFSAMQFLFEEWDFGGIEASDNER